MALTERTERAVDSTLRRLRDGYETFETVEKTWEHPPDEHRRLRERAERDALGGAGVWLTDDDGAVLLVRNERDEGWADPGGKREAGESYEAAARRELREETGLECELTGVREVHVVEHRAPGTDAPAVYGAIVIFDGDYVGGEARPREGEIAEVGWFSAPPANVLYREVATRPYPDAG